MNFIRRKLGRKLLLLLGLIILMTMLAMQHFFAMHERNIILQQNAQARQEQIFGIINGLRAIMLAGHAELAMSYADQLKQTPGFVDFHILRTNGVEAFKDNKTIDDINWRRNRLLFELKNHEEADRILSEDRLLFLKQTPLQEIFYYQEKGKHNEPLETFLIAIRNDRECHICHGNTEAVRGVVKLTTSLAATEVAIQEAIWRSMVYLTIFMIILLFLLYWIIRIMILRPIQQMDGAMNRIAQGELNSKAEVSGIDEFANIATTFNNMAEQVLLAYNGIQQERNKLATVILSVREGIVITDNLGNVVLINPAMESILNKTREQIIQQGFFHILDDSNYLENIINNRNTHAPNIVYYNSMVLDVYATSILNNEGILIGNAALLRDVSEEKKLENELRQKIHELETTRHVLIESEKLASIGRLVAGIAHEVNTPIGVAYSASTQLQEESK
ncbi:MAG: HAMP domain-containing protein, partial [Magnetococcales bacterium]|nr:HAMP domain-containing protein [Magnetococcales bacterium]